MSLAERLNPEKQALAVASGKTIYVFTDGKPEPIARRQKNITSLTVFNGRLLDSGNYKGIKDTLTGKSSEGNFYSWSHIASGDSLYGSINTDNYDLYGIWNVDEMEQVAKRNGKTRLLVANPRVLDAGDYWKNVYSPGQNVNVEYMSEDGEPPFRVKDNGILNLNEYDSLEFSPDLMQDYSLNYRYFTEPHLDKFSAIGKNNNRSIFVAHLGRIFQLDLEDVLAEEIYDTDFDEKKTAENFSRIYHQFGSYGLDMEKTWNEFVVLYRDSKGMFPQHLFTFSVSAADCFRYYPKKFDICELGFKEACDYYSWLWRQELILDHNEGQLYDGHHLREPISHVARATARYLLNKHLPLTISNFEDDILVGGKSGRIEVCDENLKGHGEHIIWQFKQPVSSIVAVPIEVYDEGIKQEIARRRRLRVCHAKKPRENVVFLRKAA